MAFSSTLISKEQLPGGRVREVYSWNGDSVTTGNIVANATIQPEIQKIEICTPSSNGDSASLTYALDVAPNTVKLTFASSDTGTCTIEGPAA